MSVSEACGCGSGVGDCAVVGREMESRWCKCGGGARGGEDRAESTVFDRGRIELIVLVPEMSGGEVDV
jgi:hypothetical protein